jgi:tetratricopeptide (TPR) repeat protein
MKKILRVAMLFAAVLLAFGCVTARSRTVDTFQLACDKFDAGDEKGALEILDGNSWDPEFFPVFDLKAMIHFNMKKYELVIEDVNNFFKAEDVKNNEWFDYMRSNVGSDQKKTGEFMIDYNKDRAYMMSLRGRSYLSLKKYAEADKDLTNSLGIFKLYNIASEGAENYFFLAETKRYMNKLSEAESYYTWAIKYNVMALESYGGLAILYSNWKDKARCLNALGKMMTLNANTTKDWATKSKAFEWLFKDPDFLKLMK